MEGVGVEGEGYGGGAAVSILPIHTVRRGLAPSAWIHQPFQYSPKDLMRVASIGGEGVAICPFIRHCELPLTAVGSFGIPRGSVAICLKKSSLIKNRCA